MRPRTIVSAAPFRRSAVPAGALATLVAIAGLSACGADDDDRLASGSSPSGERTIEIEMRDNAFVPGEIEVTEGETVRLAFRNEGTVTHDALLGDAAAQQEHEAEMRAETEAGSMEGMEGMEGMEHGSAGGDAAEQAITLEPGETGELSYTAAAGDEMLVGCHEPGHYEAGMTLAVEVTPAS